MNNIGHATIHVRANHYRNNSGLLEFGHSVTPCMLGKSGISARKFEGDGATPAGGFKILYGFYRPDRIRRFASNIKLYPLQPNFGWCDDPQSPLYNRFVKLPFRGRHEKLWREDHLYDICLVLGQNMHPRKQNGGSAIFFHLCHEDNQPTQGCIATSLERMQKILMRCEANTRIIIHL